MTDRTRPPCHLVWCGLPSDPALDLTVPGTAEAFRTDRPLPVLSFCSAEHRRRDVSMRTIARVDRMRARQRARYVAAIVAAMTSALEAKVSSGEITTEDGVALLVGVLELPEQLDGNLSHIRGLTDTLRRDGFLTVTSATA